MAFLPPFKRTECACEEDMKFCKQRPGYLIPGDLFAISDALIKRGEIKTPRDLFPLLRASKGPVVGNSATGQRHRIGTITPAMKDGRCVFLDPQDRCTIHAVAPFGCAFFDVHMDPAQADIRSLWGLKQIVSAPAYQQLRLQLADRDGEHEPFVNGELDRLEGDHGEEEGQ